MGEHTIQDLHELQALPLSLKIKLTKRRIRDWVNEYGEDGVYVSFSGGKDSTVLLHIVREDYPNVPAVFCDTGLEYPEVREFVKTFENVTWLKPKMTFRQVISEYGYPFISKDVSQRLYEARKYKSEFATARFDPNSEYNRKYNGRYSFAKYAFLLDDSAPYISHYCCHITKKNPAKKYEKETGKKPMLGTMASESRLRTMQWLHHGCNAFEAKRPSSKPMSFWTEQDVLQYIYQNKLQIASVYGDVVVDYDGMGELEGQMRLDDLSSDLGIFDLERPLFKTTGCKRTGCMFCGFGCHMEKPGEGRFEQMKITHPKQYEYIMRPWSEGGLGYKEVIDWINEHGNLHIRY